MENRWKWEEKFPNKNWFSILLASTYVNSHKSKLQYTTKNLLEIDEAFSWSLYRYLWSKFNFHERFCSLAAVCLGLCNSKFFYIIFLCFCAREKSFCTIPRMCLCVCMKNPAYTQSAKFYWLHHRERFF